jgi:hypothetical protein
MERLVHLLSLPTGLELPASSSTVGLCGVRNSLNPGEGFTMKGTSGTNTHYRGRCSKIQGVTSYDFRGKQMMVLFQFQLQVVILTGNPYPQQ